MSFGNTLKITRETGGTEQVAISLAVEQFPQGTADGPATGGFAGARQDSNLRPSDYESPALTN
jgi:hypothetical protein